jgi:predicted AlkP superfamily phosphohydrolase/phosphomutase
MQRLAVIGLDAVEPLFAERLMAEGKLPTLARLKQASARCDLQSEATWRSGRVWETLLTGTADFPSANLFDTKEYRSWQLGARKKTPFYADVPGVNMLAIDVPYMSLWYDVPRAQIVWGGHDAGYPRASRPAGLLTEIDSKFGVHPAFHNDFTCPWWDALAIDTLADALIVGSRRRVEIIGWLQQQFPDWNLLLTVLSEAHSAGEIFWHGVADGHPLARVPTAAQARRRLVETYEEIDRAVAGIIAALPRGTRVLVTSVHGMETNDYDVPSMAILPELMYRASFGRPLATSPNAAAWKRSGSPAIVPAGDEKWSDYMRDRFGQGGLARGWQRMKRRLGLGPKRSPVHELSVPIKPEVAAPPEHIAEPRYSLDWQVTSWYRKYWPRMRAFAVPVFYDGRVRINLQGREQHGIIDPRDYVATCDWVEQLLTECRDVRTGRPVARHIERRRKSDPLSLAGADADLVIGWNPEIDAIEHPRLGAIGPFPYRRTGGHTDHGFAWLSGPGIAAGDFGNQEALHLTDTIRGLLGDRSATQSVFGRRSAA